MSTKRLSRLAALLFALAAILGTVGSATLGAQDVVAATAIDQAAQVIDWG
jgi:hypothetical protein